MEKNFYVGIDLGGTRVKMAAVSGDKIVARRIAAASPAKGLASYLPRLEQDISALIAEAAPAHGSLAGIGLAFPGLVNSVEKRILSTNQKYDDAPAIDLNQWVDDEWNVPFVIDNDARMAAVGEWKYGAATDTDNLVVMTIGTGIGTSAVIEGKLLRGKHFQGGVQGGHLSIRYDGRPCNCGNIGCVEAYGSTWSLAETITHHPLFASSRLAGAQSFDFATLFEAAAAGDQLALDIRTRSMDAWSAGIINLVHAYDPEVVVIGGGVLNSAEVIMPYLTERVHRYAWTPWGQVSIRATSLPEDAGILGIVHCLQHDI